MPFLISSNGCAHAYPPRWAFVWGLLAAGWQECGVEQSRYTATPKPAKSVEEAKKSLLRYMKSRKLQTNYNVIIQ